ncbi:hypothetical protein T492DRAFT_849151 [Pavlovales sp. CCMP2436]|nr:hypothetical protein T492DRAFT_849151 [Pavlovales sp. CCMP2436]
MLYAYAPRNTLVIAVCPVVFCCVLLAISLLLVRRRRKARLAVEGEGEEETKGEGGTAGQASKNSEGVEGVAGAEAHPGILGGALAKSSGSKNVSKSEQPIRILGGRRGGTKPQRGSLLKQFRARSLKQRGAQTIPLAPQAQQGAVHQEGAAARYAAGSVGGELGGGRQGGAEEDVPPHLRQLSTRPLPEAAALPADASSPDTAATLLEPSGALHSAARFSTAARPSQSGTVAAAVLHQQREDVPDRRHLPHSQSGRGPGGCGRGESGSESGREGESQSGKSPDWVRDGSGSPGPLLGLRLRTPVRAYRAGLQPASPLPPVGQLPAEGALDYASPTPVQPGSTLRPQSTQLARAPSRLPPLSGTAASPPPLFAEPPPLFTELPQGAFDQFDPPSRLSRVATAAPVPLLPAHRVPPAAQPGSGAQDGAPVCFTVT